MLRELAVAVGSREVRAVELVERSFERIEAIDVRLHAVVALRSKEEALQDAVAIEAAIDAGKRPGPLAGFPCLIKDIEDLAGMRTTHGSRLFMDSEPADADGFIASRFKAAGAIPIGKANTSEFATEGFSGNDLVGFTRNPWSPTWSAGGSSGGSGAALAAGLVPLASATDTGGSIRCPAAFCGLVGLKPTNGVIPRDRSLPWPDLTTCGPLGMSVDDVRILLRVAAGKIPGDPTATRGRRPQTGGFPVTVLAISRFSPWGPLPSKIAAAFEDALERLTRLLDVRVEQVAPESIFRSGSPDADWFVLAGPELVEWLGREKVQRYMGDLLPTTQTFLAAGLATSFDDYLAARSRRCSYVEELDALLGHDAVIASPTVAAEGWLPHGPRPGVDEVTAGADVWNGIVQNMTGHPAITVPAGVLPNGVPFGLQLTGPKWSDDLLLDIAERWEEAQPWPPSAPGFAPFWQ
jgi:Asp-tRNA(Asn)/Glu-tRNA(Gln) amidotransferase A subunit family amidase